MCNSGIDRLLGKVFFCEVGSDPWELLQQTIWGRYSVFISLIVSVFAYCRIASAIGVLVFAMRLSRTRSRSRIRNIRGHERIIFYIFQLRKCDRGVSQRKLQKDEMFLKFVIENHSQLSVFNCFCSLSSGSPIKDSQYQRSKATGFCYFAARKCNRAFIFCNAIFKNK